MKNKHSKNSRTLSIYIRLCAGKLINKAEEANRFGVDDKERHASKIFGKISG